MTASSLRACSWVFGFSMLWASAGCGDAATKDASDAASEQDSKDDAGAGDADADASVSDDASSAGDGDGAGDAGDGDGDASGCTLGECGPEGTICGGFSGSACAEHEFCNYALEAGGMGCDAVLADGTGVCESKPEACTDELAPVCGCDHVTYGNACLAHAKGISVLHSGPCAN